MSESEDGVWVVGWWDNGFVVGTVHKTEIDALRVVNDKGYGTAHFMGFGVDVSEATRRVVSNV